MLLLVRTEDEEIFNEAKDIRNSLENFMHETVKGIDCTIRDPNWEASKCKVVQRRNDTCYALIFRGNFRLMVTFLQVKDGEDS